MGKAARPPSCNGGFRRISPFQWQDLDAACYLPPKLLMKQQNPEDVSEKIRKKSGKIHSVVRTATHPQCKLTAWNKRGRCGGVDVRCARDGRTGSTGRESALRGWAALLACMAAACRGQRTLSMRRCSCVVRFERDIGRRKMKSLRDAITYANTHPGTAITSTSPQIRLLRWRPNSRT